MILMTNKKENKFHHFLICYKIIQTHYNIVDFLSIYLIPLDEREFHLPYQIFLIFFLLISKLIYAQEYYQASDLFVQETIDLLTQNNSEHNWYGFYLIDCCNSFVNLLVVFRKYFLFAMDLFLSRFLFQDQRK